MNTRIVLFCLIVITATAATKAAKVNTALLARYVCRSRADGGKVMVPGSCRQYYLCQEGKSYLNTCPYFYDAVSQQCVNKNPGCVETFGDAPICEGPCCGVPDHDFAVDPANAAIYYLCENNCIVEKKCCENGLMFDLVKLECSSPSTCSECSTSKPPCETTTKSCEHTTTHSPTTTPCSAPTSSTERPAITTTIRTTPTTTPTTTTSSVTTTTRATTTSTRRTTTTRATTTSSTTTTCTTTTTPCPTTTTTCPPTTTTTCHPTSTQAPSKPETTTTTCTTTTAPPCTTTKAPCKSSQNKNSNTNNSGDPSHYVLPSTMSDSEIQNYSRSGCVNKPDGYLLPSVTKCNEYFICRNNNALPVSCGPKYFNVKTNSCDLPSNTGCIQANLV